MSSATHSIEALPSRIASKIEATANGCWQWTGFRDEAGYGKYNREQGKPEYVHRITFELLVGDVPTGRRTVLDHLCRNRGCCNPAHLEVVSQRENLMRGDTIAAANAAKTHCPHGHPYAGENLRIRPDGARACRECERKKSREQQRRRRARRRAAEAATERAAA